MAVWAGTGGVFQVQSTATAGNVNGGGFNPANANFITDFTATSATGNSPVIASASYNFAAGDVGAWIYVKSGTNWTPGYYQIASVAANAATVNAAIGQAVQVLNNRYVTNTVAGCATTASPTGGTCGIDYSQSDVARFSGSDLTGATTTCTSASTPFTTAMVGNFVCMASGTGVTAGWYEIVSVSGVTATLDRSAGTTYSVVVYKTGGAISLGGATTGITDVLFFTQGGNATTAGCRYFIKGGTNITYTLQNTPITTLAGNSVWPSIIEGMATIRGDRPTVATRPILACGDNKFQTGISANIYSVQFTGLGNPAVQVAASNKLVNTKVVQSNTASNVRAAIISFGANSQFIGVEAIAYANRAFEAESLGCRLEGCYFHDSSIGISIAGATDIVIKNCIIADNYTQAINNPSSALTGDAWITGCTLYGAENKLGVGVSLITGTTLLTIDNTILYGFTTGVSHPDVNTAGIDDYNDYFNNTNDVNAAANWQKGANDIAINPSFTNAVQRTGSTATTTAGNHLVQSGATFVTWGITPGVDFLYVKSGTGVTAQKYGILSVDSETQITTDIAITANATADKVWQITTGHNFLPTGAV